MEAEYIPNNDTSVYSRLTGTRLFSKLGKRTSAYDYRISKRGGKGIDSIDLKRGKKDSTTVVAIIPVVQTDELVMVSDGGQLIRMPVDGISFTGRTARGVTLFRVSDGERVVSVSRIRDVDEV